MIAQKEVNDCILATVSNYLSIVMGRDAMCLYEDICALIQLPHIMNHEDYVIWLEGHGMPLEVIPLVAHHYGITLVPTLARDLPAEPCIIVMPVDARTEFNYDCHVILWTGTEIVDPVQFKSLKSTLDDVIDTLPRAVIWVPETTVRIASTV
jgi:hypothetical protein